MATMEIESTNVQVYILSFRLVNDSNAIHEFVILTFFMWVLLNVCTELLLLKMQIVVSCTIIAIAYQKY